MDNLPLITVGIANYNYSKYIIGALESVLQQEYEKLEIIIVDDCSTDNSVEVIETWRSKYEGKTNIQLIRNDKNKGISKVANKILSMVKGKYFQILDADDILLPGKITEQVKLFNENSELAFIYSNAKVIDAEGNVIQEDYLARINYDKERMPTGRIHEQLLNFNFVSMPTVLLDTSKTRAVGGFDESIEVQDYYMWLKLSEKYEALYMNEITALYRVHAISKSNNDSTNTKSEDSVMSIKYRYYQSSNSSIKRIIRRNIQNSSVYLYQQNYPTAKKWLRRAFLLKPQAKTLFYYIVSNIGIPFSFIQKIKLLIRPD